MANHIGMDERCAIEKLYTLGWKKRRIARELGLDRKTVRRCIRLLEQEKSKSPISPSGESWQGDSKSPISPSGKTGRPSMCEPFRERIAQAVEKGLSAQRIYQDLTVECGFAGAYDSVKRFVRKLFPNLEERVHRMESPAGEEAQVDFGLGAPIRASEGRLQKTWVFRIVLSYSRKAYSEAVLRQTAEVFIRCLENAFRYFGGVLKTLVIDNLRAAVKKADWFEPELNPKVLEFCRHYGTIILPARPAHPEHKGKVESSIKYVKNNGLKGRIFDSLSDENSFLLHWEQNIADQRIHGTTRQQVAKLFEQERPFLLPLPLMLFACFQEGRRRVHRDSFVEVEKAYYEVPEEYMCRDVWVRWDGRTVRVFNDRMEQIAVHAKAENGKFSYSSNTTSRGRLCGVEHTAAWLVKRAKKIGEKCGAWAGAVLLNRGVEGIRPLYGLLGLPRRYSSAEMERACEQALSRGAYRLRDLRRLLEAKSQTEQTSWIESHALIRDMAEYGAFLQDMYPEKEILERRQCDYE